ncbi:unnamed protein product [Spodoptera exigua]|nr:unnamed protein product [Spodoptera exigua]
MISVSRSGCRYDQGSSPPDQNQTRGYGARVAWSDELSDHGIAVATVGSRRRQGVDHVGGMVYLTVTLTLRYIYKLNHALFHMILECFGNTARRDNDNLEKLLITGKVEGKRPRGRSPIRWTDQIRTTLNTTVHDALHSAADRNRWRKVIRSTLPTRQRDSFAHCPQTHAYCGQRSSRVSLSSEYLQQRLEHKEDSASEEGRTSNPQSSAPLQPTTAQELVTLSRVMNVHKRR